MLQECWQVRDNGFLIEKQPLLSLAGHLDDEISEHLDGLMSRLADLLEEGQIRRELDKLPIYDMSVIDDGQAIECAFIYYSCFASAYVYARGQDVANRIPAGVAVPLVQLADSVNRPPILAYAPYTLANWQKIDPDGDMVVDNLRMPFKFIHKRDAEWFTLIHVDIEARAARGISAIPIILNAVEQDDSEAVIQGLEAIHLSLAEMMATLKRMPEHCHPTVYYHEVRTYIMSFEKVIYEGVGKFKGQPQSFAGETGAQSSIIPAFIRLMGLSHETNSMTQYLTVMQDYMPQAHRDFIHGIKPDKLRNYVKGAKQASLIQAYNQTLQEILEFRKLHIRYAASYIANQSPDSVGTGGTDFMPWLQRLIDETETQFLG